MSGAVFTILLLAFAAPAIAEDDSLQQHVFVPGTSSANVQAADLLTTLKAGAATATGMSMPQARQRGNQLRIRRCADGEHACQATASFLTAPRSSPDAPDRLDPIFKEYVLDPNSSSQRCTSGGMRQRDPIWQNQACRRDEDFGALELAVSSSDVYARANQQGDAVAIEAGSVGDNYWNSNVYERSIEFELDSLSKFSSFAITHLNFDDWLLIKVNGKLVYVGPYGGDRLDVPYHNRVCYTAQNCYGWELGHSWQRRVNIDLLAHLQVGSNRIDAKVVVGGGGEFHMQMRASYDSAYLAARNRASSLQKCSSLNSLGCLRQGTGNCLFTKNGTCQISAQNYHCPQRRPQHEMVACPIKDTELCPGGNCAPNPADAATAASDMAAAVALLEAGRQASTYLDANQMRIFAGTAAVCRDKIGWGASDCCRNSAAGRNRTNAALLAGLGMRALKRGAPASGSKYVFDVLYAEDLQTSLAGILGSLPGSGAQMGNLFSYYGVQVQIGSSGIALSFDPTSFAIMVAASVIADLLACEKSEQLLGMRAGAGLCVKHDERCSGPFCRTEREYYCCYNSLIARQVATQGWQQLGSSAYQGGACPGFTAEQFARIDFSRIDLREFIASVTVTDAAASRLRSYQPDSEAGLRDAIRNGSSAVQVADD